MVQVMAGQQLLLCNRPDATFFTHQEGEALEAVKGLLPKCAAVATLTAIIADPFIEASSSRWWWW
jgi:hypothetical protein